MRVFSLLRQLRTFEVQHFPFVETLQDWDIIQIIGEHQERDLPISLKQILALEIGAPATIERRLARLKSLNVVIQSTSVLDKRSSDLKLSPRIWRLFEDYEQLVNSLDIAESDVEPTE